MSQEIERKFLVKGNEYKNANKVNEIVQGYLVDTRLNLSVRVRIVDNISAFITIKKGNRQDSFSRLEYEYVVPVPDAQELLQICGAKVVKKRYIYEYEGKKFEIDEFGGEHEGLIIAEVELVSENEIVKLPEWIGEEVTDKKEYLNSNLAKKNKIETYRKVISDLKSAIVEFRDYGLIAFLFLRGSYKKKYLELEVTMKLVRQYCEHSDMLDYFPYCLWHLYEAEDMLKQKPNPR